MITQKVLSGAGWSHFAQFTIAVVNKDPKKSKYSGNFGLFSMSFFVKQDV